MGNCTSGTKKRRDNGQSVPDNNTVSENKEDVMYASIDHTSLKGPRRIKEEDDECDYASVNIPAPLPTETVSRNSSKDDCADDYVLMG